MKIIRALLLAVMALVLALVVINCDGPVVGPGPLPGFDARPGSPGTAFPLGLDGGFHEDARPPPDSAINGLEDSF